MCAKVKSLRKGQPVSTSPLINLVEGAALIDKDGKVVNQINSKTVNSKIELTKPITNSTSTAANMIEPALAYRMRVDELGATMYEYAVKLTEGNMLNAKLALWEAIRRVEKVMREKGV